MTRSRPHLAELLRPDHGLAAETLALLDNFLALVDSGRSFTLEAGERARGETCAPARLTIRHKGESWNCGCARSVSRALELAASEYFSRKRTNDCTDPRAAEDKTAAGILENYAADPDLFKNDERAFRRAYAEAHRELGKTEILIQTFSDYARVNGIDLSRLREAFQSPPSSHD